MNRLHALSLIALTGGLLSACGPSDRTPPAVSVSVSPTPLLAPGVATFTATATDAGGVAKVDFYDNGTLVQSDTTAPYSATKAYTATDKGDHTIEARARDKSGNVGKATATLSVTNSDTSEPNNTTATATNLDIGGGASGVIAGQDTDHDYYKFTAAAGDMLKLTVKSVSVNAASTLDPYVMILLPDGKTVLEKDDDSGSGLESEIRFNIVDAGTYYVMVTSFGIHQNEISAAPITGFKDDEATNTYQVALTRR
ncbi:Ig-like domain-containing protein [Deinococcus sp.]|uniref:Ig-like domain-containing protein n=1 Tax=Deinococcus sp. TaxID=47478 RepID=UPI0028699BFF|nr:Ig-like domain-containing protein [Deinococcus sp.]